MSGTIMRRDNGSTLLDPRFAHWMPFRDLFGSDQLQNGHSGWLAHNVIRIENGYEVEVPVPGFRPDQVEITFRDGLLSIDGKSERRSFEQFLTLPEDVDHEKIDAKVENGMLLLTLPRLAESLPKKIKVN